MQLRDIQRLLISRTDSIGDVLLVLPLCNWIKYHYPQIEIYFLGKSYTKAIIESFPSVDRFLNWDEIQQMDESQQIDHLKAFRLDAILHVFPNKHIARLAKKAKIPLRIGTSHRMYHWLTCNRKPNFTRKKSDLHESELNFRLLDGSTDLSYPSLDEISKQFISFEPKPCELPEGWSFSNKYIILHPKSQGSALEWPLEKYLELALKLAENGYTVVFTGTDKEGQLFRDKLPEHENIVDASGKFTLEQLILFIKNAHGFVACSTGPLHISSLLGVRTVGLYSSRRPIHPGRWKPIGLHSIALEFDTTCEVCAKGEVCRCIENISVEQVIQTLI